MSDEKKLRALYQALADNLDALTDEEVLAEVREAGRSPDEVAKDTRALIQSAVKTFKQRALIEAKRERVRSLESLTTAKRRLPAEPDVLRELLAAMMAQPQAQGLLTAHGREFKDMTDVDVEEAILELIHLGLRPPGDKSEE